MSSSAPAGIGGAGDGRRGSFSASRTAATVVRRRARASAADRGEDCRPPRRRPPTRRNARRSRGSASSGSSRRRMPATRSRCPTARRGVERAGASSSSQQRDRGDDARATADGDPVERPASARVDRGDDRPTTPKTTHHDDAPGRPPQLEQPGGRGERRAATIAMPTRSAILSVVPKSAIAASFAHGGARSMSAEPIDREAGSTSARHRRAPAASRLRRLPAPSSAARVCPTGRSRPAMPRASPLAGFGLGARLDAATARAEGRSRRPLAMRAACIRRNTAATRPPLGSSAWVICSTATAPRWRRARRRPASPRSTRCSAAPTHPGAPAESREAYRELYQALAQMTQEELRGRTDSLASSYLAQGVTFDFAGEERPFPLDAVPRVITFDEWSRIESGVKQRVRALEAFLDDAYGHQHCVRDEVLPGRAHRVVAVLLPPGRRHPQRQRRAHPGVGHRPHPRRARRDAGARRQRARARRASATSSRTAA